MNQNTKNILSQEHWRKYGLPKGSDCDPKSFYVLRGTVLVSQNCCHRVHIKELYIKRFLEKLVGFRVGPEGCTVV